MTIYVARESVELISLNVGITVNDATAPTTAYDVSVVPYSARPGPWQPADTAGPDHGYLTGQLGQGVYDIWVRINDSPTQPVVKAEVLVIT